MDRTIVLLVLDSLGIGALPDAAVYGDEGSNTLKHILDKVPDLRLPNLTRLGLGHILNHASLGGIATPAGFFGRGKTRSAAKDTIAGHWEMMGIVLDEPFQTFPQGFPPEVILRLEDSTGKKFLGNTVASGTEIIAKLGQEHVATGHPILYTSADSVLQIAAHEDIVPLEELYDICQAARKVMTGAMNVARIIARPFTGEWPYQRTSNRRDYAVLPPQLTALDALVAAGYETIGIGKICDIYAGQGLTQCLPTKSNAHGQDVTMTTYLRRPRGLIFTNLVDFDALYGHRNDYLGYARALREVDEWLEDFLPLLRQDDWLFIVADHG